MNPLNLFQESCKRHLTGTETQWIAGALEEFPFFSLLHLINAKNAVVTNQPSIESLKTKAAIYSPERRLASDYLRDDFKLNYTLDVNDKILENESDNRSTQVPDSEDPKTNTNISTENIYDNDPVNNLNLITSEEYHDETGTFSEKKVPTVWEISEDNSELPKPTQPLNITKSSGQSIEVNQNDKIDSKNLEIEREIKSRIERAKRLLKSSETRITPEEKEVFNHTNVTDLNFLSLDSKIDNQSIDSSNINIIGVSSKDWSLTNQFNYKNLGSSLTSGFLERFVKPVFDPKPPTLSAYRAFVDESESSNDDHIIEPAGVFSARENTEMIINHSDEESSLITPDTNQRKTEHSNSQNRVTNEQNQIIDKIISEIHLEVSVNEGNDQNYVVESKLSINETIIVEFPPVAEVIVESITSDLISDKDSLTDEKADHRDIQTSKIKRNSGLTEKDISAFLNDFADGVDSGSDVPLTTESFKRFIAPTFDPKSATLSAYRMFDIDDEVNDVIPDEELQGYKTESFKRFVTPEFDIKSDTLSTKRYYTKDILGLELEHQSENEAFKPGSSGRVAQTLIDKYEFKTSNLAEVAQVERNVSVESTDDEKKKFTGKFAEHITSETFKKFKSEKIHEFNDGLATSDSISKDSTEISNDDQLSAPHRIRTESMKRFITPDFGIGELDMDVQNTQQADKISHTQHQDTELVSGNEIKPIEAKRQDDTDSLEINVNPGITNEDTTSQDKTSEESRIQSESMTRFVEPDFSGQTKSMTYASSFELLNEHTEHTAIESKFDESSQEEKDKDLPERFTNESMARFIEPDFTTKSLHFEHEPSSTINSDIFSSIESKNTENELISTSDKDNLQISAHEATDITNLNSEEIASVVNRTESMNRFIQPIFDEKPNTLHLERPDDKKKKEIKEISDQNFEKQLDQNENIISVGEKISEQNIFDKVESSEPILKISDESSNLPPEEKTVNKKNEINFDTPTGESISDKKIQETIIRYPGEEKDLEIKLRPEQLKYFNVNVGDVEGALNESVKIILDENQPEIDENKENTDSEFKSRRHSSPLISPEQIEAIEQDFFSSVDSQIGVVGNLNLDKVIIDYSKKTIEFIVEDTTLNKAAKSFDSGLNIQEDSSKHNYSHEKSEIITDEDVLRNETDYKLKAVESILPKIIEDENEDTTGFEIEIIESKPNDWSETSIKFVVEPKEIKNIVTDYEQFLLDAIALKDSFTEQEAKLFFKLIYENTAIEDQNFIYDIFQLSPPQPNLIQADNNIFTEEYFAKNDETNIKSRELLTKTLNLSSDQGGDSEKDIENQMNPELERSNQNIDERISKFRKNLARIRNRTITDPGVINIGLFKERFIDSLVDVMNESIHISNSDTGIESILGEATNDPSPIDIVIDRFKSFEPTIYSSINKSDNMTGSVFVDFQAEEPESDLLDYVPQTETMAKILAKQGDIKTAISIYKNLSKKYPKKSEYYLGEINKIQ